jgi:DNA-binding transcriptional regulator YdaS (Cro superfamily)
MTTNDTPFARAVKFAGSQHKLAQITGYSQNAIWYAAQRNRASAEMALRIEEATGGAIMAHELRPDLFKAPSRT